MKLRKLYIESFKNLKKINFDFIANNNINVLIGNNGCGKSNVIEAISSIFSNLYLNKKEFEFEFELVYDLEVSENIFDTISINFLGNKLEIKSLLNEELLDLSKFLPSQIIAIYSGEESRLWEKYYNNFYEKYKSEYIKNSNPYLFPKQELLYINKYYWNIAFLTLASSFIDTDDISHNKVIKNISFEFNQDTIKTLHKNSPNIVTTFTNTLSKGEKQIDFSLEEFRYSAVDSHKTLFQKLATAYLPKNEKEKLINDITITFEDDTNLNDLSEGEKKRLLLKTVLNILAEDNTLVLFDEPDVFLHPKWQSELIKNFIDNKRSSVSILLTTHSPNILKNISSNNVFVLKKNIEGSIYQERPASSLLGRDVNSILDETMDVSERNKEIENLFKKYFEYISKKDFDQVELIEKEILEITKDEESFYNDEPKFVKAKAVIQRMKMFNK